MADQAPSRFTSQNQNTAQRLSTNTVGLVALSDFRKRRAEVVEQQEREAREASTAGASGTSTPSGQVPTPPDRSLTGTPDNNAGNSDDASGAVGSGGGGPVKKKAKKGKGAGKKLLSFGDDDEEEEEVRPKKAKSTSTGNDTQDGSADDSATESKSKFKANTAVGVIPKSLTKAALRKEATEREALRREFLSLQEAVKATDIAIPFVFYDGANTPGGTVRVKKGDFVWVFLDKSRKVGAQLGASDSNTSRKGWARVGVDDLMLVRGSVIIPHHYDFYFFALNKNLGPGGLPIFDYSNERPPAVAQQSGGTDPLSTAASRAEAAQAIPGINTLEGANDDPNATMVVDRRWYERNKHIYPASTWQDFDPEKDYATEVRRDAGGNAFFFSK